MRDTARQPGVQVIVLPTLDPDTPYGVTQSLHAAYTPFRAAELGLPIVRSDITAYSMAVDGWGRVLAETGTDQDDVFTAAVRPGRRWTFAAAAGDWFLFACGLVALISIVWKKGSSEKRLGPRPDDAIERVEDASSLGDGYELGARTSSG